MAFNITPCESDQSEASSILESLGLHGFTEYDDGSFVLPNRKRSRIDPESGEVISYRLEELMTIEVRKNLEKRGWRIVYSGPTQWRSTWQG